MVYPFAHSRRFFKCHTVGGSWGTANDVEWRTGQYLVEGVKAIIKTFVFTLGC